MKKKNSGFTASGLPRPEICPGDIYRDKYGSTVMIVTVSFKPSFASLSCFRY